MSKTTVTLQLDEALVLLGASTSKSELRAKACDKIRAALDSPGDPIAEALAVLLDVDSEPARAWVAKYFPALERTITLNLRGNPDPPQEVCRSDFLKLKNSGMLWEVFPDAPENFPN